MFKFLTKEYWKKKLNDKSGMCFVIPVMSENELEDGKKYICFRKELTKYGSYIWREKFVNLTWCKKENIFLNFLLVISKHIDMVKYILLIFLLDTIQIHIF